MTQLILHLPHAATYIPSREAYLVSEAQLQSELYRLTDWYTDDLFHIPGAAKVQAPFSRIFCDVERFADDEQEIMAAKGMGMMYTLLDDGTPLRNPDGKLREELLQRYYLPHHQMLERTVDQHLKTAGTVLIVDGHSFPDEPLLRDVDQRPDRPDFNIGTDPFHTPARLLDYAVDFFATRGLSLGVDWPYAGALVPMAHYRRNKQVQAIMLEVNRKCYLQPGSNRKSEGYKQTKEIVCSFLLGLRNL